MARMLLLIAANGGYTVYQTRSLSKVARDDLFWAEGCERCLCMRKKSSEQTRASSEHSEM